MPLSVTDAERTLKLLWEFKQYAEDEDSDASLNAAISLLTGYCTEILPVITKNGVNLASAVVELECSPGEKLGICLDAVTPPMYTHSLIMISLIKPASVSDKSGLLKAGDQIIKINGHSLTGATLRRARWLLETAQRSGKAVIEVISSALKSNLKHSRTLPPSPFTALEPPPAKRSKQGEPVTITAEVENEASFRQSSGNVASKRSSSLSLHHRPSYTPSIGSRRSSQVAITSTVEVAAHIAREQSAPSGLLGKKKRKVHKIHMLKGKRPLGLSIIGGKGSKYGDVGIFIKDILVDGAAHRDGRLKINDELLLVNGRSMVGLTHNEADMYLQSLPAMVQLVVATESMHASGQTSLCSSRFSLSSIQEKYLQSSVSPLVIHAEQNSPNESAHDLANDKAHNTKVHISTTQNHVHSSALHASLEKSRDATTDAQCVPHQLLDTDANEEDGIISPQQKTFTTNLKQSEIPINTNELESQFHDGVPMGKKKKMSTDSTDFAPKKEKDKTSSGTFKVLKLFKKNRSKANIHAEKHDDDMELTQLEMSLGKSLEESETVSVDDEHKSLSPSGMSGDLEMVTPWARLSTSNITQPNNMPPSPPIKTIVIPRSQNKKLGIALGQSRNESGPPFVKSLDPDGLATKDGRISVGNVIMKVNNESLANCSAKDAASIIRTEFAKYGMVSFVISKGRKLQTFSTSSIVKGGPFTVLLTKDPKFGFGIELAKLSSFEGENDFDIVIQKVMSTENAQHIQRGDQILEVNGSSIVGITIDNVDKVLKRIKPGRIPFKLLRPTNLPAVISELDKLSKENKPLTSPLVNSYKENESDENKHVSHAEMSDIHADAVFKSLPSSVEQVKTSSSVSNHGNLSDSDKSSASPANTSKSNLQVTSSLENGVNMSNEDILRRLHRHPSLSTVKREMIKFDKGSSRMGIEVVAGSRTPHKGALVTRVFPDCVAGIEGKVRCGDEILEVNGRSIIGMHHSEVIDILKECAGLVTMLVSRSSQVLNSHSGSETSLLDDFYATEKLKSAVMKDSLNDLKSSGNVSLHSVRQEDFSEDELDSVSPADVIQQAGQGADDNVITIRYSDSSMFSTGHRTSVIYEESLPPLPTSSPPAPDNLSVGSSSPVNKDLGLPLKETELEDGPPVGYTTITLEIQKISKGKLTIVPSQKIREGYFMVRRFTAGNLKDSSIKPGDILVSLNGAPLYGIPHAQVLQNLNEAPKQSKLEIYRDPDYKLDSVYTPRASYSRASYTGSRTSLVSTDDSPQLESRGSFTDFDTMSNRGSSRRSSRKVPVGKRSSEGYGFTNSLKHYSSQEAIKQRPSSLSNFTSVSSLVARRSASSVVPPRITPKISAESSPATSHHSTPSVEYPVNTLPSSDGDIQNVSLASEDATKIIGTEDYATKTVGAIASEIDDVPMQTIGEDQVEKITDGNTANIAVAETTFMEQKKKLSPVTFGSRNDTGPFEIEVMKGFWGLGITVDCDKTGAIFVKALTSRSPLSKNGNIKVGDHLLSVNDEPVKSLMEAEQTLRKLPKGPVKFLAMSPPTNVMNVDQLPPSGVTNDDRPPPANVTNNGQDQAVSLIEDAVSDKGIITVEFNCPKNVPLGLNVAGGSDMTQKLVYIHSITPGSLADRCNKLKVGDEIVMVSNDLMVGLTWKAASDKINQLVGSFKIVAQRRETVVPELEEKQQQEEIKQNRSDSFDNDNDNKTSFQKKELPATVSANNNSQLSMSTAVAAPAQLHSEDTGTNGATASIHPEQLPVMFTDHTDGDESIKFTIKLNRPKNTPLGLNIAGGCDMPQKLVYIHSIIPGSPADKCNKFQPGDEIVTAGNATMTGLTWKAASAKINKLAGTIKIVVKRRSDSKQQQKSLDLPYGLQPIQGNGREDQSLKRTAAAPEPPSTAPPEPPSNAPPKPSSSPPTKDRKLAHSVSVDSFDSESGDEFLLQQESGVSQPNVPLQITKPARTVSLDSFDSESGDEELLKEETHGIPPKLPPTVPSEPPPSIPPELPPTFPPELPPTLPPEPPHRIPPTIPPELPPRAPPDSVTSVVTKPAHAITMDSFDSESDDESLVEQEETIGTLPDPPSSLPPDPPSNLPPDPPSTLPPESKKPAHKMSFDSESDKLLLQQKILGLPPEPSSAPPKLPPRTPPETQKLNGTGATAYQQNRSHSFDNESSDELQLQEDKTLGIISSGTQLLSAAKLSRTSINSESDDELSFVSREETFTVTFNKDVNTQLGISVKEDIDTTNGVGVRAIIKGSLADKDGRLQPGNKLIYVNGISLCGLTYKKTLEVLRNAGNQLEIVATRPATRLLKKSITQGSSINELSETSDNEEPAEPVKVGEEMFTVEFHKKGNHKLGVTITGGIDTPTGDVGVKNIVKGSLADIDGRLQQGNKLLSVNGISLLNVTNKKALEILRGAGDHITIVAIRYVGVDKLKGTPLSSAVPSLTSSRNQSPRASRKALHDPLPEIPSPRRKMSKHFQPGRTAKKSTSSLHESGHHTLPRDFGTVKAVELRKGAQGLGMQLIGGIDQHMPVTVKEIFPGGAAHQSRKIRQGDQILEINGKSFAQLTHREIIELIKNEPEGKATLLVKSASRNK